MFWIHFGQVPNGEDVDKESVHCKIEDLIKLAQDGSCLFRSSLIIYGIFFAIS